MTLGLIKKTPEHLAPSKVGSVPTFGARVNMAKVRGASNIKICWRVRLLGFTN